MFYNFNQMMRVFDEFNSFCDKNRDSHDKKLLGKGFYDYI